MPVVFLGNSGAQLEALPPSIREAFRRAIRELDRTPQRLPQFPEIGLTTKSLAAPLPLFCIAVHSGERDPGYRGVYSIEGATVLLVRFVRRDAATYKGLRRIRGLLDGRVAPADGDR